MKQEPRSVRCRTNLSRLVAHVLRGVAVMLVLLPATFAGAQVIPENGIDALCRKNLHKTLLRLANTSAQQMSLCHVQRMRGDIPAAVDCNDSANRPATVRIGREEANLVRRTAMACNGERLVAASPPTALGYAECPVPCDMIAIDDAYPRVADCLLCLNNAHAEQMATVISGTPSLPIDDATRRCQERIGRGAFKYLGVRMKVQHNCQTKKERSLRPLDFDCSADDPQGRIARARSLVDRAVANCSDAMLATLDSCAETTAEVAACVVDAAEATADAMFDAVFRDVRPAMAATATPTAAPSTPTATATAVDTPTPTEPPADTPTPTEAPADTPTPTEPPADTATPTEVPEATPTPTETPEDTATPTPSEVPTETPTSTEVPTETATPTPTSGIDAELSAPTITDGLVEGGDVTIEFIDAIAGANPIVNYEISTDEGETWSPLDPPLTSAPMTVEGASVGTVIQLRAVTAAGSGPASNTLTIVAGSETYAGSGLRSFEVPPGASRLLVDLVGGVGGRGGRNDTTGGPPSQPWQITGSVEVVPGETLTVSPGNGGTNVGGSNGQSGGVNALDGYNGGSGGNSTGGTGGGGGGGGAASVLRRGSTDLAVAAGGGGGGGQANSSNSGGPGGSTLARTDSTSTNGRNGTSSDALTDIAARGGGGGGGGGAHGGQRGNAASSNNNGGTGGRRGVSSSVGLATVTIDEETAERANGAHGYISLEWVGVEIE